MMKFVAMMIAALVATTALVAGCYPDQDSRSAAENTTEQEIARERATDSSPATQLQKRDPTMRGDSSDARIDARIQEQVTGRLMIEDESKQTFTLEDPQGPAAEQVANQTLEAPPGVDLVQLDGEEVTVSIQNGRVTDIQPDLANGDARTY